MYYSKIGSLKQLDQFWLIRFWRANVVVDQKIFRFPPRSLSFFFSPINYIALSNASKRYANSDIFRIFNSFSISREPSSIQFSSFPLCGLFSKLVWRPYTHFIRSYQFKGFNGRLASSLALWGRQQGTHTYVGIV